MIWRALPLCLAPALVQAAALDLPAPGRKVAVSDERMGSLQLPITGWAFGTAQSVWAEGTIRHEAWQLQAPGMTTLDMLIPLRAQLIEKGYTVLYECEARDCGGFDFRYALEVLPEPDMHVDLGDYRYLAASRDGDSQPEYVALLASRGADTGFLQITRVGNAAPLEIATVSTRSAPPPRTTFETGDTLLVQTLVANGAVVLDDLVFNTGAVQLSGDEFRSLDALADFLNANPQAEIVLVGHTDAEGALASNIALSKARAGAVRSLLTSAYKVAPNRITAEGVGFLAPIASNQTEEGRTLNRRVEVILKMPK